VRGV